MQPVALHVLQLPEDPVLPDRDYSRFDMRWLLAEEVDAPASAALATGDLVQLDQLLTGAGEFEGLRFVGPADADGRRELLLGDVESPVFPRAVAALAATGPTALRQLFEPALEKVVELQGFSLEDIFGGDAEAFWAEPDVQRRERKLAGEWIIKLADCTCVKTYRFSAAGHDEPAEPAPAPEPEPELEQQSAGDAAGAAADARAQRAAQLQQQQPAPPSAVPGSEWIYDKALLAKALSAEPTDPADSFDPDEGLGRVAGLGMGLGEVEMLPTWFIRAGDWSAPPLDDGSWPPVGQTGEAFAPTARAVAAAAGCVWFLKETNRNYSAGVSVHACAADCLGAAEVGKRYVVQPHYHSPMLRPDGRKFHLRLYLAACSPQGESGLLWYLYRSKELLMGRVATSTAEPWTASSLDRDVQIITRRTFAMRAEDWPSPAEAAKAWTALRTGKKTVLFSHLYIKMLTLPRQARDKHGKPQLQDRFFSACKAVLEQQLSIRLKPTAAVACCEMFGIDLALRDDWVVHVFEINAVRKASFCAILD
jgi:hypothetical protein